MYAHRNNAQSKVRVKRLPGDSRLELVDASSFGDPTPTEPIRVSVFRNRRPLGIHRAEGRDGDALILAGAIEGFVDDVEILPGDDVANVLTAGDLDDLGGGGGQGPQGPPGADGATIRVGSGAPADALGADGDLYIDATDGELYERIAGHYASAGSLAGQPGAAGADGRDGIDGKDGTPGGKGDKGDPGANGIGLPAGGTTGQLVAKKSATNYDYELIDPPSGGKQGNVFLFPGDLTNGDGSDTPAFARWTGSIGEIQVCCRANPAGGSFKLQIQVNGAAVFSSPVLIPAGDTTVKTFTSFSANSVTKNDKITPHITDAGAGVAGVAIYLNPA